MKYSFALLDRRSCGLAPSTLAPAAKSVWPGRRSRPSTPVSFNPAPTTPLLNCTRGRRAAAASPPPLPRLCALAQVGCYELLDPIVSEESELVAQHYDIFLHVYAATPTGDTRLGFRRFQPRRLMEDCGWDLAHSNADPNQP